MIQLSSPLIAQDSLHESKLVNLVAEEKHELSENKKPGIFSKLLEGLLAKNKPEGVVEELSVEMEHENPELSIASNLIAKSSDQIILPVENEESDDNHAFLKNDELNTHAAVQNLFNDQNIELSLTGEKPLAQTDEHTLQTKSPPGNLLTDQPEVNDKPAYVQLDHSKTELPLDLNHGFENMAKNAGQGKEAFLNISFREFESELLSKAAPAPATKLAANDTTAERSNLRPAERGNRRGRVNVEVTDLRTETQTSSTGTNEAPAKSFLNATRVAAADAEIHVDLRSVKAEAARQGTSQTSSYWAGFEDVLARELRGNLSTDIVRNAAFIIRNGGEGTIRLSLNPASLGDVKIRLELSENKITGQIIVQSDDAFRAFEREISVLEKAFKDSGYSETSLDMSLAQDQWNFGQEEQGLEREHLPLNQLLASSRYETEDFSFQGEAGFPDGNPAASSGRKAVNLLI